MTINQNYNMIKYIFAFSIYYQIIISINTKAYKIQILKLYCKLLIK